MPGIGIILNPHSRSNRQNPERIKRLGFIVGDKGSCKLTNDICDIPEIVHEFHERKIDILGISGGDGTNHCTLTTFINEYKETPLPKIAFLRGGTMNAIANALGIHGSPEQILSTLILKYHEDAEFETTEVDLLNVNGKYGFIFGNGLISRFIELYYKNKGGTASAFWLLLRVVFGHLINSRLACELCERYDAEIVADGSELGFKNYAFITAGTMDHFSFGIRPLYAARSRPGFFQLLGCSGTPRACALSIPRLLIRKSSRPETCRDVMAKEVVIKTNEPMTYMVDGDMQGAADTIHLKTGPRLTVIIR